MHLPSDRPVFFVHVMKTGGVTLLESARASYADGEVYPDPTLDLDLARGPELRFRHLTISNLRNLPAERRARLRLVAGHFPLVAVEALGGGFDVVTILRDPVERTISLLRQFRRPAPWTDGATPAPMAELSLEAVYEQPHVFEPLVHDHQTKLFSMTMDDQPTGYMQTVAVDSGRLARAKENLERIEVLGLTERYDDLLDAAEARFGWRVGREVRANASPDDGAQASEALRRRIAADNAFDVELYAYARALVEQRITGGSRLP